MKLTLKVACDEVPRQFTHAAAGAQGSCLDPRGGPERVNVVATECWHALSVQVPWFVDVFEDLYLYFHWQINP